MKRIKGEITILMVNIRCLSKNLVELECHLRQLQPHIVLIQDTRLDVSTESISISNYNVISRRDRSMNENRGGILTLSRSDYNKLVHIEDSLEEERSWHYLHVEPEILLLGNWYRPGATEHDGFACLQAELAKHTQEATGIILTGDFNIHHARWLRHSNGNSIQGADLKIVSENFGLQQLVREPTRNEYLLDLFLTDVAGAKVCVGPCIADHNFLLASVPMPEITDLHFVRSRFNISRVNWPILRSALAGIDWSPLDRGSGDDAATFFMEMLWTVLCTHIPYEQIVVKKKSQMTYCTWSSGRLTNTQYSIPVRCAIYPITFFMFPPQRILVFVRMGLN